MRKGRIHLVADRVRTKRDVSIALQPLRPCPMPVHTVEWKCVAGVHCANIGKRRKSAIYNARLPTGISQMSAEAVLHILTHADSAAAWDAIESESKDRLVTVVLLQEAVLSPPRDHVTVVASRADWEKHGAVHPHKTVDFVGILQLIDEHEEIRRW